MLTVFFLYSELGSDGSEYEQLSTPEDSEEADDDHDFDVDGMLLCALQQHMLSATGSYALP